MKPNPLLSLNHFTVPVVRIACIPQCGCVRGARRAYVPITVSRDLYPHDGRVPSGDSLSLTTQKKGHWNPGPGSEHVRAGEGTCAAGAKVTLMRATHNGASEPGIDSRNWTGD